LSWLVRRWHPQRELVVIGDGGFASARLSHSCRRLRVGLVSRLLLNAQLSDPGPPPPTGKPGVNPPTGPRPRKVPQRLTDPASDWRSQEIPWDAGEQLKMEVLMGEAWWHRDGEAPWPLRGVLLRDPRGKRTPVALCCTDPTVAMLHIIPWEGFRWNIEVPFHEARAPLGLGTQRQWSTAAIARPTPCLLGVFSLVLLLAHALHPDHLPTRPTAWSAQAEPTCVAALAAVRRHLWVECNSPTHSASFGSVNSSAEFLDTLLDVAWYAA
jgi:hypothetical protein